MAGNIAGGRKTRDTNLAKDPNYYSRIGKLGGKVCGVKGFAVDVPCKKKGCDYPQKTKHLIRECAGTRGGRISRRPNP